MNKTTRISLTLGLVLAVLSISYLVTPVLAGSNGTGNGEQQMLQTEECDGDMLQTRQRSRLQAMNQTCSGDGEGTYLRIRNNIRAEDHVCENDAEQLKMQHRQGA